MLEDRVNDLNDGATSSQITSDNEKLRTVKTADSKSMSIRRKSKSSAKDKSSKNVKSGSFIDRLADYLFVMVYGHDYDEYNTVADTSMCVPFWFLQTLRLLMALALTVVLGFNAYLYFKAAVELLTCWALFSSMLAIWLLFITSGQQMVYQKMLERPNCAKRFDGLVYDDLKQRPTGWTWAVFFYAQAFALSAISCFTYWISIGSQNLRSENQLFVAIYYVHKVN